jgi:hypothetical protein
VIESYNYFYLVEMHTWVKNGPLGIVYQIVKVVVMVIDLGMIALLWVTLRFLK